MSSEPTDLRARLDRLARLAQSDDWAADLNPAQAAALAYLARANRFSRSPSHLAAYLGATRGTVSQTLKALKARGLVAEEPKGRDRRSVALRLTAAGRAAATRPDLLGTAAAGLPPADAATLTALLDALLAALLRARGGRPFGLCRTCRHHARGRDGGAWCALLGLALTPEETGQICHEQEPKAA